MTALLLTGVVLLTVGLSVWLAIREARRRGQSEAIAQAAVQNSEVLRDVQAITAAPVASRDHLLERMRARKSP